MTPFPETVSDPNIVRGRLVYQMSAALESQNGEAPNLVKSISIWIGSTRRVQRPIFKNVILDPSAVVQMYVFLHH